MRTQLKFFFHTIKISQPWKEEKRRAADKNKNDI